MSLRTISRTLAAVLVLLGPGSLAAEEDPLLTALNEVKVRYRMGEYREAASALGRLAELAAAPERAAVREKIRPALTFYTAAVRFELNDESAAREAARSYLSLNPGASLDPSLYSKRFVAFFEKVKKEPDRAAETAAPDRSPDSIGGGILASYASFVPEETSAFGFESDPKWGNGPVRFLFVGDEGKRWSQAPDEDGRRWVQGEFWGRRDPTPLTPQNEFRDEFYRRVQFADANFSTEESRGSVTDRGMVFLLMGPPSYVGRSRIEAQDDSVGFFRATERQIVTTKNMTKTVRVASDSSRIGAGENLGTRDIWYFRSDRLARQLPWKELKFEFQTKEGYGTSVLQKNPDVLNALSRMAQLHSNPPR